MRVHPTFYIDSRLWETDDGVKAKSLAALALKLPEGTEIVGYHPKGFGLIRHELPEDHKPWHSPDNPMLNPGSYVRPGPLVRHETSLSRPAACIEREPESDDELMTFEPAQFVRPDRPIPLATEPEPKTVETTENSREPVSAIEASPDPILAAPRQLKAPTHYVKGKGIVNNWTLLDDRLLELCKTDLSFGDIAFELGVSKNAAIGRAHRLGVIRGKPTGRTGPRHKP